MNNDYAYIPSAFPASLLAVYLAEILLSAMLAFLALLLAYLVGDKIFAYISSISSTPSINRLEAKVPLPVYIIGEVPHAAVGPLVGEVTIVLPIFVVHVSIALLSIEFFGCVFAILLMIVIHPKVVP